MDASSRVFWKKLGGCAERFVFDFDVDIVRHKVETFLDLASQRHKTCEIILHRICLWLEMPPSPGMQGR